MSVYLLQADKGGPIKIGFTKNPIRRFASIQVHNHVSLALLAVLDGDRSLEKSLHAKFAGLRLRGEWFEPGLDLLAFIAKQPKPPTIAATNRITGAERKKMQKVWFDETILSDRAAAKLLGRPAHTVKMHLGPSGRERSKELASANGKLGAAKSSAAKAKTGHMPYRDMDKILDDQQRFPYFDQAVAALNAASREKGYTEISKSWAQRRKREGHLHYRPRISGHSKH